jgi:hypothetical protein
MRRIAVRVSGVLFGGSKIRTMSGPPEPAIFSIRVGVGSSADAQREAARMTIVPIIDRAFN